MPRRYTAAPSRSPFRLPFPARRSRAAFRPAPCPPSPAPRAKVVYRSNRRIRGPHHRQPGARGRLHPSRSAPSRTSTRACTSTSSTGSSSLGGFVRLGNRANEGHAELTVCLYLPDGRVLFSFQRPPISSNDAFDAGGLRFEVQEAGQRLRTIYEGPVLELADPRAMADPGRAFRERPEEARRPRPGPRRRGPALRLGGPRRRRGKAGRPAVRARPTTSSTCT